MMQKQDRHLALASFLSLMLYFGPNLFQDIHRVFGHDVKFQHVPREIGTCVNSYSTQCPVCVFEFTTVEDIAQYKEKSLLNEWLSVFTTEIEFQELNAPNFNFRSRAPPV